MPGNRFIQTFHGHPSIPAAEEGLGNAAHVVDLADPLELWLDPEGGNVDVTMPAEADVPGAYYRIWNTADAAENLVVKDDGGSTIVTIPQQRGAVIYCDGATWAQIGQFMVSSAS